LTRPRRKTHRGCPTSPGRTLDPWDRERHLLLRIDSREDGTPLRVDVRNLREALAEVERVLAAS
jgi:hypothetical protein